jgi:pimeloyl-ACP methyl ester carboxylesterase
MRLAYLDLPRDSSAPPAVALHREGITSTTPAVEFTEGSGLFGRLAVPTGEYAFYPSGMSIGGTCWYRILPGFEGTDPISLTTAVVEVADLIADLRHGDPPMDRPVLIGWGQGAVVALAVGLWQPGTVRSVISVDAHLAHLRLLPPAIFSVPEPPPVLLAVTDGERSSDLQGQADLLASHKIEATSWCGPAEGTQGDLDQALVDEIGRWMDHG